MARKINIIILLLLVGLNSFNTFDKDHKIPGISRKVQSWIDRAHMLSVSKLLTARDDLIRSAVSQLESEEDWNGLFHLYRWYLDEYELGNIEFALECAQQYFDKAKSKGSYDHIFYSSYLYSRFCFEIHRYKLAHEMGKNAIRYNTYLDKPRDKVLGLIIQASCEIYGNDEPEAFEHISEAMHRSKLMSDTSLLIEALGVYSNLYKKLEDFVKAIEYKKKQLALISKYVRDDDSTMLMGEMSKLAELYHAVGDSVTSDNILRKVMRYAIRSNDEFLKGFVTQSMRSNYLDRNNFEAFVDLYFKVFREEFEAQKRMKSHVYYKVMAYYYEIHSKIDSAQICHQMAKAIMLNKFAGDEDRQVELSNTLIRIGQFYLRHHKTDSAIVNFAHAFEVAIKRDYLPFQLESAKKLWTLYYTKKDFKKTSDFSFIYDSLLTLQNSKATKIIYGARIEQKYLELFNINKDAIAKEKQEIEKSAIYAGITWVISVLFLLLVSFSSIKVPEICVKVTGFVAFVFLFEFIILLLDEKIKQFSGNNMLINILIKFSIVLIIYFLHHTLSAKTIKYILTHKLIIVEK